MTSMLLASMNTNTAVSAGGAIPLGSAVHGFGRDIKLSNNAIYIRNPGYYEMEFNVTVDVTGTAAEEITLYANGVAVAAATAGATPAAAGEAVNITLPWVARKSCCADSTIYTIVASAAGTVTNVITKVVKI